MQIRAPNLKSWIDSNMKEIDRFEKKIMDVRKAVALELTNALLANIPVWSGRTARSVHASNSGTPRSMENHPDRGDTSPEGIFRFHQEFGGTSRMPLGSEPMRGSAEAVAHGSLSSVRYDIDMPLFITIGSTAWPRVEAGKAPTEKSARNHAVVSAIAIAQVKSLFGGVVR